MIISCGTSSSEKNLVDANIQLEKDLEMYQNVWNTFLIDGDTSTVNSDNFTEDVVVVTDQGDIVGIEAVKNHYLNYLNGFSDIEWKIIDAFGQGDRLVKHWNFKGKHTGDFFGIPATGNYPPKSPESFTNRTASYPFLTFTRRRTPPAHTSTPTAR